MILYITALLTLLITSIVGFLGKLKVKTANDFTSAGNGLNYFGVIGMLMGSIVGGAATVGTTQMAFTSGLSALWFIFGVSISSILLGILYGKYADLNLKYTIPQIIGEKYGDNTRIIACMLLSLGMLIHINGQIFASMSLFSSMLNLHNVSSALLVTVMLLTYVLFGGFWSGTLVGGIKAILLYTSSILCGLVLLSNSGYNEIFNFFPKEPWFNLFNHGIKQDLGTYISTIVGILSTQTYFQAIASAKNKKTSIKSSFTVAILVLPIGFICTFIGMYMRIHFPNIDPKEAFPQFLLNFLPPSLGGISIATILISSIATGAALSLGIATMITKDIYKKIINKNSSDKQDLIVLRSIIIAICIVCFIIVVNNNSSLILNWGFMSMVFRATPIFIPLMCAIHFKHKINPKKGLFLVILGPTCSILWILLGFNPLTSIYIGLFSSLLFLIISKLIKSL